MADRGFASIGYGVPGGIGAQLGVGTNGAWCRMTGDGGFNMSMGELETARRLGANFVTSSSTMRLGLREGAATCGLWTRATTNHPI